MNVQEKTFLGLSQTTWTLIGVMVVITLVVYVIYQASRNHKEVVFGLDEVMASLAA